MSKGPGRIERAIAEILDREPDNAFTTEDLCEKIYRTKHVERNHRIAVMRAAANLAKRRDNMRIWRSSNLGRTKIYLTLDNVMSYSMAWLKSDYIYRYRSHDERVNWWKGAYTEEKLRALLTKGGKFYEHVRRGGSWWKNVESFKAQLAAQRSGDKAALKRILEEQQKADDKAKAKLVAKLVKIVKK